MNKKNPQSTPTALCNQTHVTDAQSERQTVVLLTKHGKQQQVAPELAKLGFRVEVTQQCDTDQLGTFCGEVERSLSPIECAIKKARLATEVSGERWGLGSEGSFGQGPIPGLFNWDSELLALYDATTQQTIVASAAGPVMLTRYQGNDLNAMRAALAEVTPGQALILKTESTISKGLATVDDVVERLRSSQLIENETKLVESIVVEPDLRAMHCPQRQAYIVKAAQQLVERMQSLCPQCNAPNFYYVKAITGLPCGDCGTPTERAKAYLKQCSQCQHQYQQPCAEAVADPYVCQWCNP
ncbi:hypothetical protein QWY77_06280 [Thalassotalea ponticola]|uniref:DUF6671 family protein n=1 Tax=Thalassotalea ponticola TaxID=1523392 RepID=UPI0025B2A02D|nr:DUF6671 family protein [Thalassotalea ponticola]MDN3652368.1 hypothetical protein [Thalassotalea ponticola]